MIEGVDVSNWQGEIDWSAVPASVAWGYAKASEGVGFRDPTFTANWRGMQQTARARGAYDFFRPDQAATPEAEAQFFLDQLDAAGGLATGDFLVLDAEVSAAGFGRGARLQRVPRLINLEVEVQPYIRAVLKQHGASYFLRSLASKPQAAEETRAKALAWLAYVEQAVGFKPMLYSGSWFLVPHGMTNDPTLSQHGLILAAYQATMPDPAPLGWEVLAAWQYSDSGSVPGIDGGCDVDRFNGDSIDQLRAYGLPAPADPCSDLRSQLSAVTAERDQLKTILAEVRAAVADFT